MEDKDWSRERVQGVVLKQPTYHSSMENFELKTDNIFGIADEIGRYCRAEIRGGFYYEIPVEDWRPLVYTVGIGRRLEIVVPNKDPQQSCGSNIVNLGDLILSEDGKRLTLQIHALNNLLIDPKGIVDIALRYQVPTES